ncbi:MAG: LacI family DNA-binding transcriptional regulator [Verrucomicrobiota bacterium JB022]|nr:LacI family DNA-binding transcriptional regulator [Verrucomicrobiota bacterium JB022]
MKRLSQQTIAQELGVSQALVSLCLRGKRQGIADATYERVRAYAQEHGYRLGGEGMSAVPNGLATVGYLLRKPLRIAHGSNFFHPVHQGMHDQLREHGLHTTFLGSEDEVDVSALVQRLSSDPNYAGTIVLGQVEMGFLQRLAEVPRPLVTINARYPGLCHSVQPNEVEAADLLAQHLILLNHREILYLGSEQPSAISEARLAAFQWAARKHGLDLPPARCFQAPWSLRHHGRELARQILERQGRSFGSAWVCVGSLLARGVVDELQRQGLRVGEDISIATLDDSPAAAEEEPCLTSAGTSPEDLGREAASLILNEGRTRPTHKIDLVLPARLQARQSTWVRHESK